MLICLSGMLNLSQLQSKPTKGMDTILLQEKIDRLLNTVRLLIPDGGNMRYVYSDDLAQLNKSIHDQINELYFQQGGTIEQEAALCFAILMGYSVSMYTDPEDEFQKKSILQRSRRLLENILNFSLRQQLSVICHEMELI